MASTTSGADSDGPVQTLISKKIRNLRKKLTRIAQLEESQSSKALNKEQSDLVKSKPQIIAIIEEYEKLRQPLQLAVQEELSQKDSTLEDLIRVLYFGSLFDVKNQNEFANVMLTRAHERGCCLTYDYVDDDDKELLAEEDLDLISRVGSLMISKDVCSKVSHKMAVEECVKRAKLWVEKSDIQISPDSNITYAALREKLNKITSLDYFTMTPEMKAPVDVAAAVYNTNATAFTETENGQAQDVQTDGSSELNNHEEEEEEEEQEEVKPAEASYDQSSPTESENHQQQQQEEEEESVEQQSPTENNNSDEKEVKPIDTSTTNTTEHSQSKYEQKEKHQYIPRRGGYQNQRGGGRGGRGYPNNGRGGGRRGGRGGNNSGGYQNGPGQPQHYYNDSGYYPRNHYNTRGRGGAGRGGGGNNYHAAAQVELKASS